jgi:hypothetical protein
MKLNSIDSGLRCPTKSQVIFFAPGMSNVRVFGNERHEHRAMSGVSTTTGFLSIEAGTRSIEHPVSRMKEMKQ